MQKIVINNFAAIKYAEIEIKNFLILIGEQASGKSTIAKLIYFFKSLPDVVFEDLYSYTLQNDIEDKLYFTLLIREEFYSFFGSTQLLQNFKLRYYYSIEKDKYLDLYLDDDNKLQQTHFSFFFMDSMLTKANEIAKIQMKIEKTDKHDILATQQHLSKYAKELSIFINELYENTILQNLYIIEGRNATISYSSIFEKYFFADIQNKIIEQSKQFSENGKMRINADEKTINEILMLDFIKRVTKLKDIFKKYGNFDGLIKQYAENEEEKKRLITVKNKIDEILKGKYTSDSSDEKIVVNQETGEYVYLSNASSGQKESIRILQDIFMVILENQNVLRIIEEPEAHLFPVAQKQTMELLSLMLNTNNNNQLIITTHSPYILTVINNLLFAKRVVEKNQDSLHKVNEIIPQEYHLNPDSFTAYSIGNSMISDNYCENIFNSKTGLIKQSYLDIVSEMLGGDFNALYNIHSQIFAK